VKRYELACYSLSYYQIIREAKRKAGWTGLKCNTEKLNDMIKLKPSGMSQIMFITF